MDFYLGVDCGGTGTRAFATDEAGRVMGWGVAGPGNIHHAGGDHFTANLTAAIGQACAAVGAAPRGCVSVFAGVAGVTDECARERVRQAMASSGLSAARVGVDHDIRIALAGGLGGRPGIALVVGTGSSCYGRTEAGKFWQTGGWGSLISDEGSGYCLGREGIACAVRQADGREPTTSLRGAIFEKLGVTGTDRLLHRLHETGLDRPGIAALAPLVVALGVAGDPAAAGILERGAADLAEMVRANHRMCPTGSAPAVVITGGLGTAPTGYRARIVAAIQSRLPEAEVRASLLPPAVGAALLALEQAGRPVDAAMLARLGCFP